MVDDEDLDDVLKKASNANNNEVKRLKARKMDDYYFVIQGKQRYSRFRNPTYQNLALEVDRQVCCCGVYDLES